MNSLSIFHSFKYLPSFDLMRLQISKTCIRESLLTVKLTDYICIGGDEDDFKLSRGRCQIRGERRSRRWDAEHLQVAQLIFAINGRGYCSGRGGEICCYLSKQHSRHCPLSLALPRSSRKSHRLFYGYIPLPPPLPDPRPRDDVNARRHNDESRRVAGQEVELLAMVAAAGLCYLPNRMKKRAPSGPSSRKWGDTVRSKSSFFYLPPPPPSYLSPPAPSSSSSIVLPSSLSRLLTEGGTDRCEGGQKTGLRGVMRQINIGALQIVHA